jgi:hypothetical protein
MMALCDGVRESKTESGVFHLKGVRQHITATEFPFLPSRLWLFLLLSSPRPGQFPCYIRVVNDRTDRTHFYTYLRPVPRFGPDLDWLAYHVPVRCSFPEPGRYTVQVCFFQERQADVIKGEVAFSVFSEGENP